MRASHNNVVVQVIVKMSTVESRLKLLFLINNYGIFKAGVGWLLTEDVVFLGFT